jgi:hypothetical protein
MIRSEVTEANQALLLAIVLSLEKIKSTSLPFNLNSFCLSSLFLSDKTFFVDKLRH